VPGGFESRLSFDHVCCHLLSWGWGCHSK
jgi:hypothetical protein